MADEPTIEEALAKLKEIAENPDVSAKTRAWARTLLASHASLEERVKPLVAAAQLVVDQTNDIHENDPPPIKYRAPYGAIANLTRALAAFVNEKET